MIQVGLVFTRDVLAGIVMKGVVSMYLDVCLIILITAAVFNDLKSRRIPNILIIGGLVVALSYHYYTWGLPGLAFGLKGFAVGLVLLLLPFVLGGMGAGDVKLLGVIGAFKGSIFALSTFIWMALWGGVIALVLLIAKGQLMITVHRLGRGLLMAGLGMGSFGNAVSKEEFSIYYPYAVAIALGVLTSYFKGW